MWRLKWAVLLWLLLCWRVDAAPDEIWLVDIDGAIGPAVADHVVRTLDEASEANAAALILRMDTPGGLDRAMRDIIQSILASPIPVIGYVSPPGSRAASAGTYILYACHVAAMAPATNLGAATPVQLGGGLPGERDPGSKPASDESQEPTPPSDQQAKQNKVINDARAYIRGLAELRGRNAEWAEQAVLAGASLTAAGALEQNVIDLMANDIPDLLMALDGRQVELNGQSITLVTANARVVERQPDLRTRVLQVITDPSIAYMLLIVGIYGLIFEFSSPGMGAGGIIGGICLLLALYALQLLPISYSALGLLLFGLGLMVAEAFSPSFGLLGLGGIVAFIVGSLMLMDTDVPGFEIALPIIVALAVSSAAILIIVLNLLRKSRRKAVVSGLSTLLGVEAEVSQIQHGKPMVRVKGELWMAHCANPLQVGDKVRITQASGLVLEVEKEN